MGWLIEIFPNKKKSFRVKCRKEEIGLEGDIWFHKAQNKFLGGDRISLLEKIQELGSINSAAKAVGISYKTAWHLVTMMKYVFFYISLYRLGCNDTGTECAFACKKIRQRNLKDCNRRARSAACLLMAWQYPGA